MATQLLSLWPIAIILSIVIIILLTFHFFKDSVETNSDTTIHPFYIFGLLPYTIGAIITAALAGKVGSDVNYFLEFISAIAIWVASVFVFLPKFKILKENLIQFLLIIQMIWLIATGYFIISNTIGLRWANIDNYEEIYQEAKIASSNGQILADDYLDMVVLSDQEIYYQPFEYGQLYKAGLWDPSNMVEEIEESSFSMILIGGDTIQKECCWPSVIRESIETHYQLSKSDSPSILIYSTEE
jgi:hypothetical protein